MNVFLILRENFNLYIKEIRHQQLNKRVKKKTAIDFDKDGTPLQNKKKWVVKGYREGE